MNQGVVAIAKRTEAAGVTILELFNLKRKVCLITGATGHLGSAMVAALAEAGANVIATSRDLGSAQRAMAKLPVTATSGITRWHSTRWKEKRRSNALSAMPSKWRDRLMYWSTIAMSRSTPIGLAFRGEQLSRQLANITGYFLLARLLRNHVVARSAPASVVMLGSMYGLVAS
jgi:NAD(P)-dependent dehydrogenase (short-subunit alcohol dehydrogenase family)